MPFPCSVWFSLHRQLTQWIVGPEGALSERDDWSAEPETAVEQVAAVKLAIILAYPGIAQ
jgi:hypothetical protein